MQRSLRSETAKGFYEELFDQGSDSDWSNDTDAQDEDEIDRHTRKVITCKQ